VDLVALVRLEALVHLVALVRLEARATRVSAEPMAARRRWEVPGRWAAPR